MSWKTILIFALTSLLWGVSCSKSEPEAAPEPQPAAEAAPELAPEPAAPEVAGGPDPTVVDAAHYSAEFENERVRILRITYGPGEASVMHYHPDSVAVFLTELLVEMTMPDGSTEEMVAGAGDANFTEAVMHMGRNVGEHPLELVEIELKPGAPSMAEPDGPDSTVVDPAHYSTEFENERVRIVRIAYGPGEASVMHYHPDSVAVFLTEHLVEMTMPDGSTEEIEAGAGDVLFIPAGLHLPRNIAEEAWELVLVELK